MICTYEQSPSAIRVWRALQNGKYTLDELAKKASVSRRSLDNMMPTFYEAGLAHRCGWIRPSESNFHLVAVYKFGPGRNKPKPKRGIHAAAVWVDTSTAARLMVECLSTGKTHREAAAECGYATEYARKVLRVLNEQNRVHVVGWRMNGGGQKSPVYLAGEGENVPMPPKQSMAEASQRRRQRLRAEYGIDLAKRIDRTRKQGGPDSIVVDGKTVYRRREDRNARKSA